MAFTIYCIYKKLIFLSLIDLKKKDLFSQVDSANGGNYV